MSSTDTNTRAVPIRRHHAGRPRIEGQTRTSLLFASVTADEKERVEEHVLARDESISAWVRRAIAAQIAAEGGRVPDGLTKNRARHVR